MKVIKVAKILQYKTQILTSYNKTGTTCSTVKSETAEKKEGRKKYHHLMLVAS